MTQQYGTVKVDFITFTSGTTGNETDITIPVSGLADIAESGINISGDITGRNITATGNLSVSGQAFFASGIEAAPSISFVADTDTGFYNAAANEVRITTNGGDRLTVDSAGNIGIGTSAPFTTLSVFRNITGGNPQTSGSTDSNVFTRLQGGSVGLDFGGTTPGAQWIQPRLISDFAFNFGLSLCPNGGNVGIGTTAPVGITPGTTTLAISDPGAKADGDKTGALAFITNDASFTSTYSDGVTAEISSVSDSAVGAAYGLAFATATTTATNRAERLRITSTGNVGIGTSSPQNLLHLAASIPRIQLTDTDTGADHRINASSSLGNLAFDCDFSGETTSPSFVFNIKGGEKMRINSSGNVGIGTSTPQVALDLDGQTNTTFTQGFNVRLTDNRTAAQGVGAGISFRGKWNTASPTAVADFAVITGIKENNTDGNYAGALVFGTRTAGTGAVNTERMRISSTGDVGIGTTDPATKLQLTSDPGPTLTLDTFGNTAGELIGAINFNNRTSAPSDEVLAYVKAELTSSRRKASLQLGTGSSGPATTKLYIDSEGKVGIGTTVPDELLHIQGNVAEFKGTNTNPIDVSAGTEQVFKFGIEGQKNNVYGPAGSIIFRQDGTWSSVEPNFKPTRIELCTQDTTTTDNSETPRLVINNAGNVGIGVTAPSASLEISNSNPTFALTDTGNANTTFRARNASGTVFLDSKFNNGNGVIAFTRNGESVESARIDSSGRLFINNTGPFTSSPASLAKFSITGNTIAAGNIGYLNLHNLADISANFGLGAINFAGQANNGYTGAQIFARADANWSATSYPTSLLFYTVPDNGTVLSQRMAITNSGNILMGTSSTIISGLYTLQVAGSRGASIKSTGGGSNSALTLWNNENVNDCSLIDFRTNTVDQTRGSVTYNASTGVIQYNTTSDYRAKTLNGLLQNASDSVASLSVYEGTMNGATQSMPMMVAHEVQEVAPYCVTGEKDATDENGESVYQQLDYNSMVPLLTAALQEALAKIETLEQRLTDAGL